MFIKGKGLFKIYKKTMEHDGTSSEVLKALGDRALQRPTHVESCMTISMYEADDFLKIIMVPLPMKNVAKNCKDFRTASFRT